MQSSSGESHTTIGARKRVALSSDAPLSSGDSSSSSRGGGAQAAAAGVDSGPHLGTQAAAGPASDGRHESPHAAAPAAVEERRRRRARVPIARQARDGQLSEVSSRTQARVRIGDDDSPSRPGGAERGAEHSARPVGPVAATDIEHGGDEQQPGGRRSGADVTSAPPSNAAAEGAATAAERLLNQGEPLLAYNVVQEALREQPAHVRLRQLQGLALARSGDVEEANRVLARLAAEGFSDAETLGMLARTHKDLALGSAEPARRAEHLEAAFELYSRAYESARRRQAFADAYYTGINAATLAVLRGELASARVIAAQVQEQCELARRARPAPADYWLTATLGEAALILGDADGAAAHYGAAVALAAGNYGNLGSTRKQAELLAAHIPGDRSWIRSVLSLPPVLVYTGHRMDDADRAVPRFPASLEAAVRAVLAERLAALRPLAVYGSAASGTDVLCLELAGELGAETHVVLPFPAAAFRRVSVEPAGGTWPERFDRVLAAATSVTVTSDHHAHDSAATFEYANLVLTGMGRLRGQLLGTEVRALAVWDPATAGGAGGAASVALMWRDLGLAVEHIDLAPLRDGTGAPTNAALPPTAAAVAPAPAPAPASVLGPAAGARHEIRAMLFADAVGFSQLSEDQIPGFVSGFLGAVADLNARTSHRPEHIESSGDGLYMVFRRVEDAARYALELAAAISGSDCEAAGLPPGFKLRIALHCGPVYCGWNPVTQAPLYTGPHTSRAARIEPVTPPGQVYASSAFAAALLASGVDDLVMRYVGRIMLPKNYGALALYHVQPPT